MMVRQFGKLAADEREKIAQSAADFKARVP